MTTSAVFASALGCALANAVSSVLQHRIARLAPQSKAAGMRFLAHLLANVGWWIGLLFGAVGLVLQAIALSGGELAVVQPLLVSGLMFAIPVSVLLEGRRPRASEIAWAAALVVALAVFLVVADPRDGKALAGTVRLAVVVLVGTACIAVMAAVAGLLTRHRAVLLGSAAGLGFGISAALLKQTTAIAEHGAVDLLTQWPIYGLIVVGGISIALTQLAFRAGPLASSLPALTILDPASAVVIGALAFGETVSHAPGALAVEVLAFAVMGVASARLARRLPLPEAAHAAAPESAGLR